MSGRDVVRLVLLSAPRRPIVTKHAHRTSGVPLPVNCSCATRKQLRGPLLSVKNASPCADLELATQSPTVHSYRRAITGSIRVARRAGSQTANSDTRLSRIATDVNTDGSFSLTPNSSVAK